jgi:hypothetical protein
MSPQGVCRNLLLDLPMIQNPRILRLSAYEHKIEAGSKGAEGAQQLHTGSIYPHA